MRTKMRVRILSGMLCGVMLFTGSGISTFAATVPEGVGTEILTETESEEVETVTEDAEESSSSEIEEASGTLEEIVSEEESVAMEEEISESAEVESETDVDESSDEESEKDEIEELSFKVYNNATYELTYEVDDEGYATITGYTGTASGDLIIPSTIGGLEVYSIDLNAFQDASGFDGILELPDGLKYILHGAFRNCSGLKGDLVIPDSVLGIYSGAFEGCSGFDGTLDISESMTSIPYGAFMECSGLKGDLVIPENIKSIGQSAFEKCSGFNGKLVLPEGVQTISQYAFMDCSGLTGSLEIPKSLSIIANSVFSRCSGFTGNLVIPNTVTEIEDWTFHDCTGFTGDLVIPDSVQDMGSAFSGCSGLDGSLTLSKNLSEISDYTFQNCTGLKGNLVLPEGIKYIGEEAFRYCEGFTGNLEIPKTVTEIGNQAFYYCKGFNGDLEIPANVKIIGENAFSDCEFDGELKLNDGLEQIEKGAFSGCYNFKGNIEIPNSVTMLGELAFSNCESLDGNLVLSDKIQKIDKYTFYGCVNLCGTIELPENIELIDEGAFSLCEGFTGEVIIPDKVKGIYDEAFEYCEGLTDIYFPSSVSYIGDRVFSTYGDDENLDVTMHCVKDSYAWNWAIENGFTVVEWEHEIIKEGQTKDFLIFVMDEETGLPLSDVNVLVDNICHQTRKDGSVKITRKSNICKEVVFSKENYQTKTVDLELRSDASALITLKDDDKIRINIPELNADFRVKEYFTILGKKINWMDLKFEVDFPFRKTGREGINAAIPLNIEFDKEKKTAKVTFGIEEMDDDGDVNSGTYDAMKALCNRPFGKTEKERKKSRKAVEDFLKKTSYKGEGGKLGIDVDTHFFGFFEYDLVNGKLLESGAIIGVKGKGSLTHRPTWGGGVVYIKTTLSIGADGKLLLSFEDDEVKFVAELDFKEALKIAGGLGGKNVHLEVGAEGYFTQKINFERVTIKKIELGAGADVYIEAKFFLLKGSLNRTFEGTWAPYSQAAASASTDLYATASPTELTTFDLSQMEMMDRDYLTSAAKFVDVTSSDGSVSRNISQENVYPEGDPQICVLSDGSLLAVWIADNGTKSDANRTTLVYSVYKNKSWSNPQAVCETGRGDFYPSLVSVGNKAYLSWTNMDKELADDVSTEDMVASTDLYFAVYENGSFSSPVLVTESGNGTLELDAVVTADGERQAVVWLENSENDPFYETGTTSIWRRRYENGSWQNAECLVENLAPVTSMDAGFTNGKLMVSYTQDLDGDINTTEDTEVFFYRNGENTRDTSDGKVDKCISIHGNTLYWSSEGEIVYVNTDSLYTPIATGIVGAEYFSVLDNGSSKAFVFPVADGFKNELYVAKEESGNYMQPVPVTDKGGHISDYALVYNKDASLSGILFETEVIEEWEESPYGNTVLSTYGTVEATNLSLESVYVDEANVLPGASVPVEMELYNESSLDLTRVNVTLQSGGNIVGEQILSCDIKSGEMGTLICYYQLADHIQTHDLTVKVMPVDYADSDETDNTVTTGLAYGDVAFTDTLVETTAAGTIISGKVVNQGYGDVEDVIFTVLEGGADGTELYSLDFGQIAAGAEEYFSYTIPESYLEYENENDGKYFYINCEASSEERQYDNNSEVVVAFPVKVTGVSLSAETLELPVKSQTKLTASVIPSDAVNQDVYFTTDDSTVAVVSEDGTIIATGVGTAVITAISADGGYAASCEVTVVESDAVLYHLEKQETTLDKGSSEKLLLFDAEDVEVTEDILATVAWTSSDESVATVASDGTVTAVSSGTARITANIGETFYDSCVVTVNDMELQAIAIVNNTVTMSEGDNIALEVLFMPENTTTEKTLTWASGDEAVATVSADGTVTAFAEGKTVITATSVNGKTTQCEVTVNALPRYTVTFDPDTGEEAETVENILYGGTITLPEEPVRNGYFFLGWYTQPNGQGECFTEATAVTETMTVYAYWIYGKQYEEYTVENIPDQIYTGGAIKPVPVVLDGGTILKQGNDYTVTYRNNKKVGTGQVIVKGKGNYTKTMTITFNIVPKSIEDSDVTITCADKVYNGKKQVSNPVVKWGKKTLKKGKDYLLTFSEDQISEGTVTVKVEGINNYKGSVTTSYRISTNSISKAVVDKIPSQAYTGEAVEPVVVVRPKKGAEPLVLGTDYEVTYENNTASGKAKVIIKGIGIYGGTKTVTFTIGKKELSSENITVSLDKKAFAYTGSAIKPIVTVVDEGTLLKEGTDYTLSYKNNVKTASVDAKKAPLVTIKGKGSYSGSRTEKFAITPRLLTAEGITITVSDVPYTGKSVKPSVVVKDGKTTLKKGKDYTLSYENCVNIAEADSELAPTVTITGIKNYSDDVTKTFSIYKKGAKSLVSDTVKISLSGEIPAYTGNAIKPSVVVKDGSELLTEGVDYTVSYKNNKNAAGKDAKKAPTITIKGKGAYSGSRTEKFTILPKEINARNGFVITVKDAKYTKKALKPAVTVMDGKKKLKSGRDYVLSYSNNVNVAEREDNVAPTVTITGKGNYGSSVQETFRIYEKNISSVYVQKIGNELYTGKGITPTVVVKPSSKSTQPLYEGTDYTVTYDNNIKIGKAKVTITGKGKYGGTKKVTFLILPKWLKWFT